MVLHGLYGRVARNRYPVAINDIFYTLAPGFCIHADVKLELDPDTAAKEVTYDEPSKTIKIPLAAINDGQRRTKMVMFTCNQCGKDVSWLPLAQQALLHSRAKCLVSPGQQCYPWTLHITSQHYYNMVPSCCIYAGGRSARLVNPVAWEKGAVFCQCQHCGVWHTLRAAKHIMEEVRYNDPDWQLEGQQASTTAMAAAADIDGACAVLYAAYSLAQLLLGVCRALHTFASHDADAL